MDILGMQFTTEMNECSCGSVKPRRVCKFKSIMRNVKATIISDGVNSWNDVLVRVEHDSFGKKDIWMDFDFFMQQHKEQNQPSKAVNVHDVFPPKQEEVEEVELIYLSAGA